METSLVAQAARNNAIWCDLICSTHGSKGRFSNSHWHSPGAVPRFYPNLVTLREDGTAVAEQLEKIEKEIASTPRAGWSVKDSFNALDLRPLGFQRLFEATWIWRAPSENLPYVSTEDIAWTCVRTAAELESWEKAWSGEVSLSPQSRIFHASLLDQPDVIFFAGYRDRRIIGGAIANRTDGVVGLSNVFAPPLEQVTVWIELVGAVNTAFPGLPLVGYERGDDLMLAEKAGFQRLIPLSVWALAVTP